MAQPVLFYSSEVVPPRWAQWLMRPIGWPFFSLMCLAALYVLWLFRVPFPFRGPRLTLLGIAPFFAGLWLVRLILRLALMRIYRIPRREFRPGLWRYGVPFVVGLSLWTLVCWHVPETLAWRLSEPALRRYVEGIIAAESPTWRPDDENVSYPGRWVGLYRIDHILYFPSSHAVTFTLPDTDHHGFAYCPKGPPHSNRGWVAPDFTPLEGKWYRVEYLPFFTH